MKVNEEDLYRVLSRYIVPLFDSSSSVTAIATNTSMLPGVISGFSQFKKNLVETKVE